MQTKCATENPQPSGKSWELQLSPDGCEFTVAYLVWPKCKNKLPKITYFDFPKDTYYLGHPVIEAVVCPAIKLWSLCTTGVCTLNIKMSGQLEKCATKK